MRQVVGAVLVRGGRMFMTQRKEQDSFPWGWESPGGQVETTDQGHFAALDRELREEVGVTPNEAHVLWEGTLTSKYPIHYTMFLVLEFTGDPSPKEGQPGSGWFDRALLVANYHNLLPANQMALAEILPYLR